MKLRIELVFAVALLTQAAAARTYVVNNQAAHAADDNDGTAESPFRTIGKAASLAGPGDTVMVKAGTYRERVAPARGGTAEQPVVYTAAPDGEDGFEAVVIKASALWQPQWQQTGEMWFARPDPALFDDPHYHEDRRNPFHVRMSAKPFKFSANGGMATENLTIGMVLVDGERLRIVADKAAVAATPGSWISGYLADPRDDNLYLHFPPGKTPRNSVVEISTRRRCFAPAQRGLEYITVRGFTLMHAASQFPNSFYTDEGNPQEGALGTRRGGHWLIERNTIRDVMTAAMDVGGEGRRDAETGELVGSWRSPGRHTIRHNVLVDCGAAGILGAGAPGLIVQGNVIARTNDLRWEAAESGGMKTHRLEDGLIEGNLFYGNYDKALWLDAGYNNTRVTRNVFVANHKSSIMIELGRRDAVQVDHNLVIGSGYAGIYQHDASAATIAHNLVVNSTSGGSYWGHAGEGYFLRTVTTRAPSNDNRFMNNLLIHNQGNINLPYPTARAANNGLDYNVYSLAAADRRFFVSRSGGSFDNYDALVAGVASDLGSSDPTGLRNEKLGAVQLTLAQWQQFWSGKNLPGDQHSTLAGETFTASLDPATWILTIHVSFDPGRLRSARLPGLDRDFFGIPLKNDGTDLPGPFQDLKQGVNVYKVWSGKDVPASTHPLPEAKHPRSSASL